MRLVRTETTEELDVWRPLFFLGLSSYVVRKTDYVGEEDPLHNEANIVIHREELGLEMTREDLEGKLVVPSETKLTRVEVHGFRNDRIVYLTLPDSSRIRELGGILEELEKSEGFWDGMNPKRIRSMAGVALPGWMTVAISKYWIRLKNTRVVLLWQ